MSTEYYSREIPDSPFYINGKAVKFDLLSTNDEALIKHLNNAALKRVGGVIKLTQDQYNEAVELKKKVPLKASSSRQHQREEVRQKVIHLNRKRGAAVAVEGIKNNLTPEKAALTSGDAEQYRPKTSKGIMS